MTVETNSTHGEEQKARCIGLVDEDLTGEIIGAADAERNSVSVGSRDTGPI
jgi:hypothetical protein